MPVSLVRVDDIGRAVSMFRTRHAGRVIGFEIVLRSTALHTERAVLLDKLANPTAPNFDFNQESWQSRFAEIDMNLVDSWMLEI